MGKVAEKLKIDIKKSVFSGISLLVALIIEDLPCIKDSVYIEEEILG